MDFDIATQWPALGTAVGWLISVIWLWRMLATGKLHTQREFEDREAEADDRIADIKDAHSQALKSKDAEIEHLRATAVSLAESVAIQSKVQEQQLQTSEIVKSVMAGLQKATGHTGPQRKVNQGES